MSELIYPILSVAVVSLVSLVGIIGLSLNFKRLNSIVLFLVSFSAGALFADAFVHLIPEAVEKYGFSVSLSLYVLSGIVFFFIVEKFIHWHHCHTSHSKHHVHSFAYMNLLGDAVHNFIDGLIIGASYLVNIPTGIATTLAVVLHEIPQEIGDFGVLLHGGFSRGKALFMNFLTSLTALLGTVLALVLNNYISNLSAFLVPFAAGGFIYIAGSDLIPELHKEEDTRKSLIQLVTFLLGMAVMFGLLLFE